MMSKYPHGDIDWENYHKKYDHGERDSLTIRQSLPYLRRKRRSTRWYCNILHWWSWSMRYRKPFSHSMNGMMSSCPKYLSVLMWNSASHRCCPRLWLVSAKIFFSFSTRLSLLISSKHFQNATSTLVVYYPCHASLDNAWSSLANKLSRNWSARWYDASPPFPYHQDNKMTKTSWSNNNWDCRKLFYQPHHLSPRKTKTFTERSCHPLLSIWRYAKDISVIPSRTNSRKMISALTSLYV